jgi:hypothetical protein
MAPFNSLAPRHNSAKIFRSVMDSAGFGQGAGAEDVVGRVPCSWDRVRDS